ncbi:MAG TPA: SGNH/GDSL hydrolase family protein [Gemmatimonadaceae bacterium]|nr:SGNH/GDSL hydrolase family protein [Gemmatimonadaceae bacterium]
MSATLWAPFADARVESPMTEVERWRSIARRAIYFGHQSVGYNITAGLEKLSSDFSLGLKLVETHEPSAILQPAFVHFRAGRNMDPASKNTAMLKMLESRPQPDRAIVLLKYCYVDIDRRTDINVVFAGYQAMVRAIRARYPDVTIVHSTVPLTTVESPAKARAKELLGRPSFRQDAIARQRYNELVRAAYSNREPLFDIARVESISLERKAVGFEANGKRVETLAPEYTSDGGHLNERGQAIVAKELLNVLARAAEIGG